MTINIKGVGSIMKSMIDKEEFERWFKQAEHTHISGKEDLKRGDYDWSCFKAHQSAELALKALLRGFGKVAVGHSISKLLQEIENLQIEVEKETKKCSLLLEKYYIPTRYPDVYPEGSPFEFYDLDEANKGLKCATKIMDFVKKVIESAQSSTE